MHTSRIVVDVTGGLPCSSMPDHMTLAHQPMSTSWQAVRCCNKSTHFWLDIQFTQCPQPFTLQQFRKSDQSSVHIYQSR